MTTLPLVSVVIPVRNRPSSVLASIQSVLAQDVPVEVIVVDDASTDETPNVLQELANKDSRVRVILQSVNGGGGKARNAGIDAASAPWLAFLDSDDLWLPGKLSAQLDSLGRTGEESVISFTNLLVDHADGSAPMPWITDAYRDGDSARSYLLDRHQVIQTSTLLMRTDVARQIRFDPSLRRHQDIDFVLRAERDGVSFKYLDACLVNYSADPKASRVSKRVNAAPSLAWMEVAKAYLTEADIGRFYLRHVFDMEHHDAPWAARRRGWAAVRAGAMAPGAFVWKCIKQAVPARWKDRLRGRAPHA